MEWTALLTVPPFLQGATLPGGPCFGWLAERPPPGFGPGSLGGFRGPPDALVPISQHWPVYRPSGDPRTPRAGLPGLSPSAGVTRQAAHSPTAGTAVRGDRDLGGRTGAPHGQGQDMGISPHSQQPPQPLAWALLALLQPQDLGLLSAQAGRDPPSCSLQMWDWGPASPLHPASSRLPPFGAGRALSRTQTAVPSPHLSVS